MHVSWYFSHLKFLTAISNWTRDWVVLILVPWFELLTILTNKGSQCTLTGLMSLQNTTLKRFTASMSVWNLYKFTPFKLIFSLRILVEMLVEATEIAHPLIPSLGLVASNLKLIHSSFWAFFVHRGKTTFAKWVQVSSQLWWSMQSWLLQQLMRWGVAGHANILDTHSEGNLGETRQNHIQICSVLGLQQP